MSQTRKGRPPGFDRDDVVGTAGDLFWRKGLAATSYEELTTATGLHRPSLHAAFGSKHGLFEATLGRYLRESGRALTAALSRSTLAEALEAFFATDLSLFLDDAGGRGCYALSIAVEAARLDPGVRDTELAAWRGLDAAIAARLDEAHDDELPAGLPRRVLADLIVATHVTVAIRARAGATRDELEARIGRCLAWIVGSEWPKPATAAEAPPS